MKYLVLLSLLWSLPSLASTFVGNGGLTTDVEYQVTLKEIQTALQLIEENKNEPIQKLCYCYEKFEGHPICDTLNKLSQEQVKYCSEFIQKNNSDIRRNLYKARIRWTNEEISVSENNGLRAAEAVTDEKNNQITIQQERFLEMRQHERMFLMVHEMGHLVKVDGKNISDNQEIGPFKGADGGREFLNAVAAGVVMEAMDTRVLDQHKNLLSRSRANRTHWLEISYSAADGQKGNLKVPTTAGSEFSYRFQFNENFAAGASLRSTSGEETYYTSTKAKETQTAYSAKLYYRHVLLDNIFSPFAQSYFLLGIGAESMTSQYELSDSFIGAKETARSTSPIAELGYYFPIKSGFWVYGKASLVNHKYEHQIAISKLSFQNRSIMHLGVSYGF